jgi:3-dehydroquinate dehydratase-2
MINILIVYGANFNLLGQRDSSQYGTFTLDELNSIIKNNFPAVNFSFFHSNSEEEIINKLNHADEYDGLIINPGGYTHTSVGIRDALEKLQIPKIEAHLSNISAREKFRNTHITTPKCDGYISGFKEFSLLAAVYIITKMLSEK